MLKKRNLILTVLAAISTIAFACLPLFGGATAYADGITEANFYMESGASIYINKDYTDDDGNVLSGVKFRAYVPDNTNTYGMLIVPNDYLSKAEITISSGTDYVTAFAAAYEAGKIKKPATVVKGLEIKQDGSKYYVEHSIVDILANNYDRNWFGIAFCETSENTYTYAKSNNNVRSIEYVASAILNQVEYNSANLPTQEKELYTTNKTIFENIVSTAIENVVGENGSVSYELSGNATMTEEATQTLSMDITNGVNLNVYYSVSDESIATVEQNGLVTAVSAGNVTVYAKSVVGNNVVLEDSINVTVKSAQDVLYDSLTGDELDKKIVAYASDYQAEIYSAEIDNNETKGDGSTSSMKFTFTQPADKLYQNANAVRGTMFLDDSNILYNACDGASINWATAYIGLWIKSSVTCNDIALQFATTQNGTDYKGSADMYFTTYWRGKLGTSNSEWKYLEVSLANAAIDTNPDNSTYGQAFDYYTENVTGFKFSISTELNVGTGNTATFWIDGLSVYNKQESDEFDLRAVEEARSNDKGNYACEINYDSAYIKEGYSSLKYTFTYGGTGNNRGIPFCYTGNFTNDLFGITADMFAEELYVGFWYKQAAVYENKIALNVGAQNNDGTGWQGASSGFRYTGQVIAENNTEWQYIEVKLSDYLTANNATQLFTSGVKQYQIYISTEINYSTATFYIDCMSVYTQSKLS